MIEKTKTKKTLPNRWFMMYYTRKAFLHKLAEALLPEEEHPKYVIRIRGVHDVQ